MGRDRLPALAGGVTFYLLLATFPAIAAFVSLYGLFSDVGAVERQLTHLDSILPARRRHPDRRPDDPHRRPAPRHPGRRVRGLDAAVGLERQRRHEGALRRPQHHLRRDREARLPAPQPDHLRRDAGGAGVHRPGGQRADRRAGVLPRAGPAALRRLVGTGALADGLPDVGDRLHACSIATAPAAGTRTGAGWCSAGCWRGGGLAGGVAGLLLVRQQRRPLRRHLRLAGRDDRLHAVGVGDRRWWC